MLGIKQFFMDLKLNLQFIFKWLIIALILGGIYGFVGATFHLSVDYVTQLRFVYNWIVYLLPIGGIAIVFLYHSVGLDNQPGTNTIIQSVRQQDSVPTMLAPAIFLATVITHLVGGSSGREGAALQIGGSIATTIGNVMQADQKEMSILVMCGMSAVFSALFGTPLTAALFAMEVVSVGIFYYAALVPCLCSSLVSFYVAQLFGCESVSYTLNVVVSLSPLLLIKLIGFTIIIAIVSICFVLLMHFAHNILAKEFKNPYVRVIFGSIILLIMVYLFGRAYLGAGMDVVESALYIRSILMILR